MGRSIQEHQRVKREEEEGDVLGRGGAYPQQLRSSLLPDNHHKALQNRARVSLSQPPEQGRGAQWGQWLPDRL